MTFPTSIFLEHGADSAEFDSLACYVARQLDSNFPLAGMDSDASRIRDLLPVTLSRIAPILKAVRAFQSGLFKLHNSLQYCTFLYLLANENFRTDGDLELSERLFCLNRMLNSVDLFYSISLPPVFFVSHGLGAVLGDACYGNGLVFFQNVTVGRVGDSRPTIGRNVVLYAGAVVTGRSVVGDNSVVSANVTVHNQNVPSDVIVTSEGGNLVFKPNLRNFAALYLNLEDIET